MDPRLPLLKPMDTEELLDLLDGHTCILPELFKPVDELFESLRCPKCGGKVEKHLDPARPFRDGQAVPNFNARCVICGCQFTPDDGIIFDMGGVPAEGPNPTEGMSSVDPRNDFNAEVAIEQALGITGSRPRRRRG